MHENCIYVDKIVMDRWTNEKKNQKKTMGNKG